MSVSTYNPDQLTDKNPVVFTDSAIKHLSKQVEKQQAYGITFNVKESGCSGYKYLLELALELDEDAIQYPLNEILILYVSPQVIPLIKGTQVDYIQEGVNYRLNFTNPNATGTCGCGESFSVEG